MPTGTEVVERVTTVETSVTIIGPVPPFKGGIAQHTAHLAEALQGVGIDTHIETWAAQYPRFLYPGEQYVPRPDRIAFSDLPVKTALRWFDPVSWVRCGWRCRPRSRVVFTLVVPVQVVPFLVIRVVAGVRRNRARFVVVAHNVLPHEPRMGDRFLVSMFLRFTDGLVVHSGAEAEVARSLAADNVDIEPLPPHPPTSHRADRRGDPVTKTLLFFGLIRPYKGLDDLLDALVLVDDVRLMVCGELWGERGLLVEAIAERGLTDRIELRTSYVADEEVPAVFAACDALVLPYRSGTGSQNVLLGHQLGVPVIATDVAGFGQQIIDGVTGFVCPPGDPSALAATIRSLYAGDRLAKLRSAVADAPAPSTTWQSYLATLCSL